MTTTEDDLAEALRQLHDDNYPSRQPGEFAIMEYANAQTPPISRDAAAKELESLLRDGKLEKPPKRFIDNRFVVVYKLVTG